MYLHNLGIPDGEFETKTIAKAIRSFGFCSVRRPVAGDLVSITRPTHKVLYQILSVEDNAVPRYEDVPEYKFWRGAMIDVIETGRVTPEIRALFAQQKG